MPKEPHTLAQLKKGQKALIQGFLSHPNRQGLEQRLLEFGLVEGTLCELAHEGFPNRDPIAVKVGTHLTVALRRSEAAHILVQLLPEQGHKK